MRNVLSGDSPLRFVAQPLITVQSFPVMSFCTQLIHFCTSTIEEIIHRYAPGLHVSPFFAGFRLRTFEVPDFIFVLSKLEALGVQTIAGLPMREAMLRALRQVNGPETDTFGCYRVAESVLRFGPFSSNPLVAELSEEERSNLLEAFDATGMYDPKTRTLPNCPCNFWTVLARAEEARRRLGVLQDTEVLDVAIEETRRMLFREDSVGYFDDADGQGRFDIYTADVPLFTETYWDRLGAERMREKLDLHSRLVAAAFERNGASINWGRSIGALSICLSLEYSCAALRYKLSGKPEEHLARAQYAFERLTRGWFQDGLISAHRGRMTYAYRGPHRLLQMTFDCLGKIAWSALQLREAEGSRAVSEPLFPERDDLLTFSKAGASVWFYRNKHVSFQYPLVGGSTHSDYVSWLHGPGLFENPVDSTNVCGVPRLLAGGREYVSAGVPVRITKTPGSVEAVYEGFKPVERTLDPLPGGRHVKVKVRGDSVEVTELWRFDAVPDAVTYAVPEARWPLQILPQLEV
jgi:hypothetical protein